MKKIFKKVICECGCNASYIKWINPEEIPKYKVTDYSNSKEPYPLEITRLSDNTKFRLGDTLLLVSANGKIKTKAKLYNIQVESNGFMQLHAYALYTRGTYCIRNEKIHLYNAEDHTNFMFLKNITKSR